MDESVTLEVPLDKRACWTENNNVYVIEASHSICSECETYHPRNARQVIITVLSIRQEEHMWPRQPAGLGHDGDTGRNLSYLLTNNLQSLSSCLSTELYYLQTLCWRFSVRGR